MSREHSDDNISSTTTRQPENEFDDVHASTSYIWHSFLLLSLRLLNRTLDWYTSFFNLTNKDKSKIYRNLSQNFINDGSTRKAILYLKQWSKLEKNDPEPYFQMGVVLDLDGQRELALEAFDKALKIKPHHVKSILRKSSILLKSKEYEEATDVLRALLADSPDDPRAHYLMGLAYDGKGQLDKAFESLTLAVKLNPDEIKYHQYLGFINVRLEDHESAARHFTKVMELERDLEKDKD